MNAAEAKKLAAANKKQMEENVKIRHEKVEKADSALLYKYFHDKIDETVKKGLFSVSGMSFDGDRFEPTVITDVTLLLRDEGYFLSMEKHNAYNKLTFSISWV